MLEVLLIALGSCTVAGCAALLAYLVAHRRAQREQLRGRFRELVGMPVRPGEGQESRLVRIARRRLSRAGIAPALWQIGACTASICFAAGLGAIWSGWLGALLLPLLLAGAFWALLAWLVGRRQRQVLEHLPVFLEHILRAVETGSSVALAIEGATAECAGPLRELFERVIRQVKLGANLEDALQESVAEIDLRELHMIALTLRVNQQFGGSIRELLRSAVSAVRQRERTRREFSALTGETRISAWVLGLLPGAIIVYCTLVNPEYQAQMRADPAGRVMMGVAAALQICGSLLLWRMVRSV
jgi:tight adherence protein B